MIKYYTHQTPPPVLAEPKSELPDECRQSDFVPLPALLERFIASGASYVQYMTAQRLSAEEKEKLFEQQDVADLAEEDISVQKAFVDSVSASVVGKKKEVEPTQPEEQDAPEKPTQPVEQDAPEKPETAENA